MMDIIIIKDKIIENGGETMERPWSGLDNRHTDSL